MSHIYVGNHVLSASDEGSKLRLFLDVVFGGHQYEFIQELQDLFFQFLESEDPEACKKELLKRFELVRQQYRAYRKIVEDTRSTWFSFEDAVKALAKVDKEEAIRVMANYIQKKFPLSEEDAVVFSKIRVESLMERKSEKVEK